MKNLNVKTFLVILGLFFISFFLFSNLIIGNKSFQYLKSLISSDTKELIKTYIFPYYKISQQEDNHKKEILEKQELISSLKMQIYQQHNSSDFLAIELLIKKNRDDIKTSESILTLSNNKILKKYNLSSGFYSGILNKTPGSGYIDFHQGNIIVLSSRGVLAFKKNIENTKENFKQIKNNISQFIGLNQFSKQSYNDLYHWFSLKDLHVHQNKIFISYTEEIKEDCWNTSLIFGDMNYENIKFKKLFSSKDCIHSIDNIDKTFNAHQSGGRIITLNDKHVLLSIGDYRSRFLTQDVNSVNGKIIKVNIENSQYEIISMGHRNPQGLYFDVENNVIFETEHGPRGGDEINLIEVSKISKEKIQNYGWPISSYGEHYEGRAVFNKTLYEKYPLYKSHSEHGFIEPLKAFVPSIGISEIVKVGTNKYVVSSMVDKSLYFFELSKQKKIINVERVEVYERVRDLKFNNNQLFLFIENSASIGVLNFN